MKRPYLFKWVLVFSALLAGSTLLVAQQQVSGQVTDEEGAPLIAVNILEVGTSKGTITDLDGNYNLTVSPNATLSFSYTGYEPQTVAVNNQSVINVTLAAGTLLDEIVVVGY